MKIRARNCHLKKKPSVRPGDKDQTKGILWPTSGHISGSIDADHDVQTSCLDKQLAERYTLTI